MSEMLDKLTIEGCIDREDGLRRMMGNEKLYEKCLKLFVPQANASRLAELFAAGDIEGAIKDVHSLKGVTGNLSMNTLFPGYNEILTKLRDGSTDGISELVEKTVNEQRRVCGIIGSFM